jgi:dephospho-CoA kinase
MIKIGLTGGIGSGKTTVAKIFNSLMVPVYEADRESKRLLNENPELKQQLKKEFGENIYLGEKIIRDKFAEIIFKDGSSLQKANNIIHPFVQKDFERWVSEQIGAQYVIEESAIIFENNIDICLHDVIVVVAPVKIRIKRVVERDDAGEEKIIERMKHQMDDEEKIKRAGFCIRNDEKLFLIDQVINIHEEIIKLIKNGKMG